MPNNPRETPVFVETWTIIDSYKALERWPRKTDIVGANYWPDRSDSNALPLGSKPSALSR